MRALDSPWCQVSLPGFRACFAVGLEQDPDTACDVDVEVLLPDGSRWGATLVTAAEVQRRVARRPDGDGDDEGGYFWCPDTLVVRDAGVDAMSRVVARVLRTAAFTEVFRRLPD